MIDKYGNLKCDACGKKFGKIDEDGLKVVCSRCKRYNKFDTDRYYSLQREIIKKQYES